MIMCETKSINLYVIERHENSKAAEMGAGAHSVFRGGLHHFAATRGPCASFLRGIPEHTDVGFTWL